MAAGAVSNAQGLGDARVRVTLLGPFTIKLGGRSAGPWYRPPAKRLCELVMVSPGLRVGREVARELLFAELAPSASAAAISRALSLAREALSRLGEAVPERLRADRAHIWFSTEVPLEVDLLAHEEALRSALAMEPGSLRDTALSMALAEDGVLLEDEPYADWALRPREALELVRQRARLELARDRARGRGRSAPEAVIEAWEACLAHDPTSEEAASSLMRVYSAQGQRQAVSVTYERCRGRSRGPGVAALAGAGRGPRAIGALAPRSAARSGPPAPQPARQRRAKAGERAVRRALRASGHGRRLDPEDLRQLVGEALAAADRRGGGPRRDRHLGLGGRPGGSFRRTRGPRGRPRTGRQGWAAHPFRARPRRLPLRHGDAVGPCRYRDRAGGGRPSRRRGRLRGGGGGGGGGRRPAVGGQGGLCPGGPGHPRRHRGDLRVGAD